MTVFKIYHIPRYVSDRFSQLISNSVDLRSPPYRRLRNQQHRGGDNWEFNTDFSFVFFALLRRSPPFFLLLIFDFFTSFLSNIDLLDGAGWNTRYAGQGCEGCCESIFFIFFMWDQPPYNGKMKNEGEFDAEKMLHSLWKKQAKSTAKGWSVWFISSVPFWFLRGFMGRVLVLKITRPIQSNPIVLSLDRDCSACKIFKVSSLRES